MGSNPTKLAILALSPNGWWVGHSERRRRTRKRTQGERGTERRGARERSAQSRARGAWHAGDRPTRRRPKERGRRQARADPMGACLTPSDMWRRAEGARSPSGVTSAHASALGASTAPRRLSRGLPIAANRRYARVPWSGIMPERSGDIMMVLGRGA